MKQALRAYLDALWRDGDHRAAVIAAAVAEAGRPWDIVHHAGLLARCRVEQAGGDLHLDERLRERAAGVPVPEGAPYPVPVHAGRRRRGGYDTPATMARALVRQVLRAAPGEVRSALDPACGTGAFLVALHEAGVAGIRGSDLDPLAVEVARRAAPGARVTVRDAFEPGEAADVVVGNPPFVPPERQDKELRRRLRERFDWLKGRFDLAVPFAAVAASRARGVLGLVLPAPALVQPYGAPLRRRWLERHRIVHLSGPHAFPGASVEVALIALRLGEGPAPVPDHGVPASEVLALPAVPLDPGLRADDVALVRRVRARSVELGDLCLVDTGVVVHQPGGSREALLYDEPGPGRVPYADASAYFRGERRWLDYQPDRMHRAKEPARFEQPKIVVQRVRGRGAVRAAVDRDGVYVGHTCTVVCPREPVRVPLERLRDLIASPLAAGITRIERGRRTDLYPRDVRALPVPQAWLEASDRSLEQAWELTEAETARLAGRG